MGCSSTGKLAARNFTSHKYLRWINELFGIFNKLNSATQTDAQKLAAYL